MVDALDVFKKYENYESLDKNKLKILRRYACSQFKSWTLNYDFYQNVYDDCNNLYFVIMWRKAQGLRANAIRGEKVENNAITFVKIDNFFV